MSLLKGTEVVVSETPPRERKGGRLAAVAVLVVLILAGVAFYGRWVTTYRYSSGELRSFDGTGAQSGGGEGPFTLDARDARLRWYLNPGVDHVQIAVITASAREKFADWPESDATSGGSIWSLLYPFSFLLGQLSRIGYPPPRKFTQAHFWNLFMDDTPEEH